MKLMETLLNALRGIFDWLFECRHNHVSRVFTIQHRSYQVCFDCGQEVDYSLQQMHALPRHAMVHEDCAAWPAHALPLQHGATR